MKTRGKQITIGAGLLVVLWSLKAVAYDLELRPGGKLQTDVRVRLEKQTVGTCFERNEFTNTSLGDRLELPSGFSRNENIFKFKLDVLGEAFSGVIDIDMVWLGMPERLNQISDLSMRNRLEPVYLETHALYLEATDLFVKGLDVRIGNQKVVWGVGDQFNPTNTLNPEDLEDVILFGEQMANLMTRLDFQFADMWTLSGVLVPIFKPAQLPRSAPLGTAAVDRMPFLEESLRHRLYVEKAMAREFGYPTVVRNITPELPENNLSNMQFAFRLAGTVLGQDLALSYYHGRDDMPVPIGNHTQQGSSGTFCDCKNPENCISGFLFTDVRLVYPEMDVFGLNLAGEIPWLRLGYRLEIGAFFPKEQEMVLSQEEISLGGFPVPGGEYPYGLAGNRPKVVSSVPFYKWVLGLDYSFGAHVYANVMWVHGFPDEFGIGFSVRQGGIDTSDDKWLEQAMVCALYQSYEDCASYEIVRPRLGDYLVTGVDLKFLETSLLVRLFAVWDVSGVTERSFDPLQKKWRENKHGFFSEAGFSTTLLPEINYNFGNGFDWSLGGLLLFGKPYSKFGDPAAGGSLVFTRARYSY